MARTRGGAQKRPRQSPRQQGPRKSPSRVSAPAPIPDPLQGLDFTALDWPILNPLPGPSTSTVPSTPSAGDFFPPLPSQPLTPRVRPRPRPRSRSRSRTRSRSANTRSGSGGSRSASTISGSGSSRSGSGGYSSASTRSSGGPTPPRTPTGRGSGGSRGARRRLLFTNSPNFGPVRGQKRPGQKVTVTETRTVTTVRKGKPPKVRRESRRQNLN